MQYWLLSITLIIDSGILDEKQKIVTQRNATIARRHSEWGMERAAESWEPAAVLPHQSSRTCEVT